MLKSGQSMQHSSASSASGFVFQCQRFLSTTCLVATASAGSVTRAGPGECRNLLFLGDLARSVVDVCMFEECGLRDTPAPWRDENAVPGNLYDLLEARLDCLGQGKVAAQQGAVIGRQFSYELLAAVSPRECLRCCKAPPTINCQ